MSHADTIRDLLTQYVPNGFRDEDGVAHDGPWQLAGLAALDALLAENQRLREALENIAVSADHHLPDYVRKYAREALAGDAE